MCSNPGWQDSEGLWASGSVAPHLTSQIKSDKAIREMCTMT